MDGTPSETWRFIEPLAVRLRKAWPDKEVVFHDERFTSVMAHRTMLESGIGKIDIHQIGAGGVHDMLPVRADTRIQYRLELVFFYGDSSRHADCDVGEEELSVDGEGHAVAACVGGIADDSGTTFACTFATRPFLSGNVFGVGIGEQRAWIGEQHFAGVAVFVDHAHPQ